MPSPWIVVSIIVTVIVVVVVASKLLGGETMAPVSGLDAPSRAPLPPQPNPRSPPQPYYMGKIIF